MVSGPETTEVHLERCFNSFADAHTHVSISSSVDGTDRILQFSNINSILNYSLPGFP